MPNREENKSPEVSNQNHIESNVESNMETKVLQENHIQNEKTKETHIENNPQITKEINEAQNISQVHNENILNEAHSQRELEITTKETTVKEHNQQIFNEAIHRDEWIEEKREEEQYIVPHRHKKEKDTQPVSYTHLTLPTKRIV